MQDLPADTLVFLLGSRYCETDLLSQVAWNLFGNSAPGWARVQAICDWVHNHISCLIPERALHEDGLGSVQRTHRRVRATSRIWP